LNGVERHFTKLSQKIDKKFLLTPSIVIYRTLFFTKLKKKKLVHIPTLYLDTNSYHCFTCDANGDIFNLYGEVNHINDFKIIANELSAKYNIFSSQPIRTKKQRTKPVQAKEEKDYTNFFAVAEQHLNQTGYLTKRGIPPKIQQKFHCGYVPLR